MHALGVPTTRALSLVSTGAGVLRDQWYRGAARLEPGAVVARLSPSFVRFGTFQLPASRGGAEDRLLFDLADYVIRHHYPHLCAGAYAELLTEAAERTVRLVAARQALGFTHGVLNTDNMSILGLSIDYGPFGFLEYFDPNYTPNLSDLDGRRYSYASQPEVVRWNVRQLADAFAVAGLVGAEEVDAALERFTEAYVEATEQEMGEKLGLAHVEESFISELWLLMAKTAPDFTLTFRALASVEPEGGEHIPNALLRAFPAETLPLSAEAERAWGSWLAEYRQAILSEGADGEERCARMDRANPLYVPRNHLLQQSIASMQAGDPEPLERLLEALRDPFTQRDGFEAFAEPAPLASARKAGIGILS
mmetsp:Transcript_11542/g.37886  ORF Transcript_11542/g.37886 Transcript_11542/m.37886 type:complete len:365 (+) Transcript_11542:554-1648(+)